MTEATSANEATHHSLRRIAANMGWLSAGNAISLLLVAGYGIALARLLGPALFGDYVYITSLLALATPVSSFGLHMILVREMSNRPQDRGMLLGSAMALFFFLSLAAIALLLLTGRILIREQRLYASLCIVSMSLAGAGVRAAAGAAFVATEKMRYDALLTGLRNLLLGLCVIPAAVFFRRLEAVMWGVTFAYVIEGGVAYLLLRRVLGRPILSWDVKSWISFLRRALPLFVGAILSAGYDRTDVLVLRSARGATAVGQYRAVYQIWAIVKVLVSSLTPALSATIYRSMEDDQALHTKVFRLLSTWVWGLTLWLALCTSLGAGALTALVFGPQFLTAAPAMAVLAWSLPLTALTYAMADFFVAADKQAYSVHVWAAALLTNVGANLLLTYKYGMMGAAVAMVISSMAFCVTQVSLAHSRLGLCLESRRVLMLTLSCGIAWGAGYLLLGLGPCLSLLAATGVFFGLAACFGAVGRREVRLIQRLTARG